MTWGQQNTQDEGFEQMDYAFDMGINFFDTAEMYAVPPKKETQGSTEKIIGNWFEKTKNRTSGRSISSFQTLEEKLIRIKELRSQEKITEAEYQKRKEELLENTGKSISSFQTLEEKLLEIKDLWLSMN